MLFLPLDEDSLLFRLCLYYGLLVLLLELLVPLLFQRRVRIEIPRLALRGPAVPLSTREFQQRRQALQQQLAALQRALAETPRRSPQKRQHLLSASASKSRSAGSPFPSSSPLASLTSSVKVSRPESSRKISESKQRIDRNLVKDEEERRRRREDKVHRVQAPRKSPMAIGDSLATRATRSSGFSFDEAIEEGDEMKSVETVARRRKSPTFSGKRPIRLVSDDVENVGYSGPSEATLRLETLIRARTRQRASTSPMYTPPPRVETGRSSPVRKSPPARAWAVAAGKPVGISGTHASESVQLDIPSPIGQREGDPTMDEDEETKESEQRKPLTDFQAFCASFATGGSAAAQQAAAKRKHHEAFGLENEQSIGGTIAAQRERYKQPRVTEENEEQSNSATSPVAADPQRMKSPKHYETFGSDEEQAIDEAFADQQVLEKRTHHQAFGTEETEERPHEKTPRIVRRISFTDEVDTLTTSPLKESAGERSNGKRKHQQAFGMIEEDDEDAEWRDSLAFRPHRFG